MQWYKKIKNFFLVIFAADIRNDYKDDGKAFHVLPKARPFMQSSVKGDYRLYRLNNSFCAQWKDQLIARNDDGTARWEIEGWSRCLAVNPDKTQFAAAHEQQLCIFNASMGTMIHQPHILGCFIEHLTWTKDHKIVASDGYSLFVFNEDLQLINVINHPIEKDGFIAGLCDTPYEHHVITLLDFNNQKLRKINLIHGELVKEQEADFADQLFVSEDNRWIWTTLVNGTKLEEIRVVDNKNLRERLCIPFKGKEGVRFADQLPTDISYQHWISLPALSEDRQYFLVNDNSGLLWLVDSRTGDIRRIFTRFMMDYVYATLWLDDEHFVAMLEGGYIVKMNIRAKKLSYKHQDLHNSSTESHL